MSRELNIKLLELKAFIMIVLLEIVCFKVKWRNFDESTTLNNKLLVYDLHREGFPFSHVKHFVLLAQLI